MENRVGWPHRRLDELGFVGRGKSRHRPRNDERLYGGPYPFIQTADIMAADPYINKYTQTYSELGLRQSRMWPSNTLCITIAGANTAKTAILRFQACFPDSIVGFIPAESEADLHFVKYSLDLMRDKFLSVSRGATQDNLSIDKLLSFPIPTPKLEMQQRIGKLLAAYDELIENNQRRIRILEEMARRLYREWFVHFRFPGHESHPRVPSPLGEIPQGWTVKRVGDAFDTVLGGTPSRSKPEYWQNGVIPWINSGKINEIRVIEESELITQLGLKKSAAKLMPSGTTVLAITGATLGQVSRLEIEATANQSVIGVIDPSGIFSEWIYLTFRERIGEIIQHASGGAQQHINKEIVNDVRAPLPPESVATQFKYLVSPVFRATANYLFQVKNLRRTRDLLLPRLLSGQIKLEAN